jgi:hypothetical protein
MGVSADIREKVRKKTVAKIHGQPTNQDITIFEKELIAILANIPTTLRGENHQHAGIHYGQDGTIWSAILRKIVPKKRCFSNSYKAIIFFAA